MRRLRLSLLVLALPSVGCEEPETCEEDIRAQVLDERVEITLEGRMLVAELADDAVERDRGWRHRLCDREALLLVPDQAPEALGIWGCALSEPLDAVFIAEGEVIAVERIEPCPEPCSSCPIVGQALEVDAVLELPLDPDNPAPAPGASADFELP